MEIVHKIQYVSKDGRTFDSELRAFQHEKLLDEIEIIIKNTIGKRDIRVDKNEGYFQHDPEACKKAWKEIVEISKPYLEGDEDFLKACENPETVSLLKIERRIIYNYGPTTITDARAQTKNLDI